MRSNDRVRGYENLIGKLTGSAVRHTPMVFNKDGYVNFLNKYGTSKDTSEHYKYEREPEVPDEQLEAFYEGNGLFARIIDAPAEEALRTGFTLKNTEDQKIISFMERSLDELNWDETAISAIKWSRLFGGSIAVLLVDDGHGIDEPLDWKSIKSIDDIRLYDRSLIVPDYTSMYVYEGTDPFKTRGSRLGMPERYMVNSRYGSFEVHESRCLIFQNGVLPENCTSSIYQMWGMPEYVRLKRAIRDAEVAAGSATKLLDRAVQAVYSMKDLSALLQTEEGEDTVLRRLQTIDLARGLMNTITIDSEGEDYSFRQFSFTGVSEVIDSTCNYLSALTNIPQTILFGRSPAGMSATGQSDLENYYNFVQRIQKRMLRSNLRYLLGIIFQAGVANGEIEKVPKIDIEFNPLWSMSDMEKEQLEQAKIATQTARANAAASYVQLNVLTAAEVRKALAEKDPYDVETILDDVDEKDLFPEGMPPYKAEQGQEQGAGGDPMAGGGDPMAAMMGGMPGGAPKGEPKGETAKPPMAGSVKAPNPEPPKKQLEKKDIGNAMPDAPDATRLPEDKTQRAEKVDKTKVKIRKDEKPVGCGVLVVKDGKILTGIRRTDSGYGLLCGPGGKIEAGETPIEGAKRETMEEFRILPKELIFIGRGEESDAFDAPYLFLCTEFEGEPEVDEMEMDRPVWRSVKEIKSIPCYKAFGHSIEKLETFLEGIEQYDITASDKGKRVIYHLDNPEKELTNQTYYDNINKDGAPLGNKNAAGPHNMGGGKNEGGKGGKNSVPKPTDYQKVHKLNIVDGKTWAHDDIDVKASKSGKTRVTIKSGTKIDGIKPFAGMGAERALDVAGQMAEKHGGKRNDWSHYLGFADVEYDDGKVEHQEIHWFGNNANGDHTEFKVKWR